MPTTLPPSRDAIGAKLALAAPAQKPRLGCADRHLTLVAGAFCHDVDAEELRSEEGENPAGAHRAEEIGDGIGDGDQVEFGLGLFGRQARRVDRIGGKADRGRDRVRAGEQSGSKARSVARDDRSDVDRQQTENRDDHGEKRLRRPVRRDAAHELRADTEAHREQEHDEEDRLHLARDLDAELADHNAGQQRAGDGAKAEAAEFARTDPVADGEREEDRQLRICAQGVCDVAEHVRSLVMLGRFGLDIGLGGITRGTAC